MFVSKLSLFINDKKIIEKKTKNPPEIKMFLFLILSLYIKWKYSNLVDKINGK